MPSDFVTIVAFEEILDIHINQLAGWLNGDSTYAAIAAPLASDASNYLLTLRNTATGGKALSIIDNNGSQMLTVDATSHFKMTNAYAIVPATLGGTPKQGGLYRDNVVHAHAYGTMSGTTFTSSSAFNCTVARAGAGLFTMTFTTAPPNARYTMLAMGGTNVMLPVQSAGVVRSTTSCQFAFYDTAGSLTDPTAYVNLMVLGGS